MGPVGTREGLIFIDFLTVIMARHRDIFHHRETGGGGTRILYVDPVTV